jgi:DNA-directed RNA polymerase subunit E'/Rpb7
MYINQLFKEKKMLIIFQFSCTCDEREDVINIQTIKTEFPIDDVIKLRINKKNLGSSKSVKNESFKHVRSLYASPFKR